MNRIKLVVLLFAISNLFSSTDDDYETISVVSKIPKSANTVISSADKIDKTFLRNSQSKDLTSLLRESLALDTSSNGGIGQLSSVFLRGTNSNHMLVKVNGVKINPSTAGGASIYNLDTDLINSVEIGYGPLSSVHGSEAVGGVMNISTKPIERESNYKIGIQGGPDNYQKELLSFNYGFSENIFTSFSGSRTKTDGFPALSNSQLDRAYDNYTVISSVDFSMNDFNLDFSSWKAGGEIEYLVFGAPVSQDYENSAYGMTLSKRLSNESVNKLSVSTSEDFIKQNNPNFLGLLDLTKTKRDNLELSLIRNRNSKVLRFYNFGLDSEKEDVDYSSYGTTYQEKIRTNSIFGSLGLKLYGNPLNLTFRRSDHDTYKDNLSWNIEGMWNLSNEWRMGLTNGSSFRSPLSSELYGFGGNTNLKPEINKSTELNFKRDTKAQKISIAFFDSQLTNLIAFDYEDYVLKNITESTNKGLDIKYKLNEGLWNLSIFLRIQDPKDLEGNQLLRRSKKSASLTLTRETYKTVSSLNVSSFGKRLDFGNIDLPSYNLVNLSFSRRLNDRTTIFLKLENLFDENYYTAAASNAFYLNQDRALWLKFNYETGR
tara:strand:- start:6797 stop:8596 length:1800 start_codon:yes stop_codon:yes gene_type:complete